MSKISHIKYMVLCNLPYRLREIAGRIAKKCRRRKDRSLEAKLEDIRNLLIYNHPISSVPPATVKLRLLQDGNTVLLALFARKCRENGLRYWLDYGTLLGAVRHRGFIPWDDDADIGMLRDDFEKFRQIAKRDLDERFFFQTARRKSDYYNLFDQVGIINSSYTTEDQLHLNMFHGIHVDIFAYDYFSENDQESKSRYLKLIKYVQKLHLKKRKSFVNKKNVLKRVIINYKYYFMKLVPFKVLINKINKIQISKDGNKNEIGCWFMERGVVKSFNYNDIFPIINKKFEDVELPVPNNYHKYLTKVYGDYMELPPEELRTVRNRIVDISFDRRLSNEIEKGEKLL